MGAVHRAHTGELRKNQLATFLLGDIQTLRGQAAEV